MSEKEASISTVGRPKLPTSPLMPAAQRYGAIVKDQRGSTEG